MTGLNKEIMKLLVLTFVLIGVDCMRDFRKWQCKPNEWPDMVQNVDGILWLRCQPAPSQCETLSRSAPMCAGVNVNVHF